MSKKVKILVACATAVVVVIGGFVVWFTVLRDDAELVAGLPEIETTASTAPVGPTDPTGSTGDPTGTSDTSDTSGTSVPGATASSTPNSATTGAGGTADGTADGSWTLQPGDGDAMFVGYNVEETLRGLDATATGTTGSYEGSLTVDDASVTALSVSVDMTTLASDEGFRDNALRDDGLETDDFPQAVFTLVSPIALPGTPTVGREVTVTATGELDLHGTVRMVDVAVTARWNGDSIDVTGTIPIVLADYGITAPSRAFVSVRDEGEIVFVLRFAQ